jgi:hypothetical protein
MPKAQGIAEERRGVKMINYTHGLLNTGLLGSSLTDLPISYS